MKTTKKIVRAMKSVSDKQTKSYDTTATVKRIEGSTAWVHIPGGIDETPVELTIAAKIGDVVQVRVGGGRAWIVGNATAPPTDDTVAFRADFKAIEAQDMASDAQGTADRAAVVAKQAQKIAGNTNQYFWHTETGLDTGAHITEVPQDEFVADPDNGGGNLLARSNGIAVRDGLEELASFSATGQTFNNEYGRPVLETGRLESTTYSNKMNFVEYSGESPFVITLPWGCSNVSYVYHFDASYTRLYINPPYTVSGRTISFNATACATLIANNVKYCRVTYDAVGNFPYYTFGSDGVGAIGLYSIREGENTVASGNTSHAEGESTTASGGNTHAEGKETTASGGNAHAEGNNTTASSNNAHAEGNNTTASGNNAHAEGHYSEASGGGSHAEGYETTASGDHSHAEGRQTEATQMHAHAEGNLTTASGYEAHAEGYKSTASGNQSHAQNIFTKASSKGQTAMGQYNVEDSSDVYGLILGNGTADNARKNAMAVTWTGLIEAENVPAYGECTDSAGTVAKSVTVANPSFTLQTGAMVAVKFTNANSATNPTLNVNSTGAKSIMRYGTTVAGTSAAASWNAGSIVLLMYDGTNWIIVNFLNTTYSSMSDAEISAGTGTSTRVITPARLKSAIWTWAPSAPSDKRLKEHVEEINGDLIRNLIPVHYIRDGHDEYGFYAQDVAEYDDVLVGEDNGYMTLNYRGLIAPLVAYVQRLEKRIEELEKEK